MNLKLNLKKKPPTSEPQPRSIIEQIMTIIQIQRHCGISNFVIAMSHAKYFDLERELQAERRYAQSTALSNGVVLSSVMGVPILPSPTPLSVPADVTIIAYTDNILTAEEALEYARSCRKKITKIREV